MTLPKLLRPGSILSFADNSPEIFLSSPRLEYTPNRARSGATDAHEPGRIMRTRTAAKAVPATLCILLSCGQMAAQWPAHCAQILYCLFDQEAAASDPSGIHKYSRDVIDSILPNQWTYGQSPSGRMETFMLEFLGDDYAATLADRLAKAEQAARAGHGKLIAESDIARAFNDLMKELGAPPSLRTDEASIRKFREHAAAIKAFPALFSADRNGTNCNPGEAVFLLSLLISDNGILYEGNLNSQQALMHIGQEQNRVGGSGGFAVAQIESMNGTARGLILSYTSHHFKFTTKAIFNKLADTLAF